MKKFVSKALLLISVLVLCFSVAACTPAAGKSAYEIACEKGFIGTETEWLQSLSGKDGRDGVDGKDGQDGNDANEIDIYALFDAYHEIYQESTFEDFLHSFLVTDSYDIEIAAAKAIRSVVSVWSRFYGITSYDRFGRPATYGTYYIGGAGVVYRQSGGYFYIITNYHVIYDYTSTGRADKLAEEITLYCYGTETAVQAEFIGGSITKDIAVIKASAAGLPDYTETAVTADSNDVALGQRVIAVGNPLLEGLSVTSGVVSVDSEEIEMAALNSSSGSVFMRVMRTDTGINSGNSGGGLFNVRGELLGIVNAKTVDADAGVENMGYAIPVNVAAGIADCVIGNNSQKLTLGITVKASSAGAIYDSVKNRIGIYETVAVESVAAGGLAEGKLLKDDILVSAEIKGTGKSCAISRVFHLSDFLYFARPGDVLSLTVKRGGEPLVLEMTAASACFSAV